MKFSTFIANFLITIPSILVNAADFKIDCNGKIRQATHCANGSLYGIIEKTPGDYKSLVDPIHPFVMRNPARGGNGNQHAFGDAIKVAQRLAATPGAMVSIDLADILPNWPYKWPGIDGWLNEIKSFIKDKKASGTTNWYGYEIWNEPDGTWKDANGLNFNELWKKTFEVIRQEDPSEKIIGPCDSWYNENRMRSFLQFCKTNNVVPDVMCWHELGGVKDVSNHIKAYRKLEQSLGIKELPISINEYCDAKHEYEGQPGSSARFIGKFERNKVDSAMISWWFVPQPGRLGSLLATDTEKGAGWYFYKWYGDMTGDMVNVTPPNDNSDQVDGAASVGADHVSFIFGGPNDGTINATFENLPAFVGSTATVKAEKVDWTNKDAPSKGPDTIFEKTFPVTNGKLTVSVPGCNATSGYRIFITGQGGAAAAPAQNQQTQPAQSAQPAEQPAQQQTQPVEQPAQQQTQPVEQPAQQQTQPVNEPVQQPAQNQQTQPVEQPAQQQTQPAEQPAQQNNQWNQNDQQQNQQQNQQQQNNQWNQNDQQQQQQQQPQQQNNQWNQNGQQQQQQQQNQPQQAAAGGNCAALWAQCGGINFSGATCCSEGTCKQINEYYHQCTTN